MISCPLLSPRGAAASSRADWHVSRSTATRRRRQPWPDNLMSKLKQRGIRSWSCTRWPVVWFSGRHSGFVSGSHTISTHREGNLPALLQSAPPLELSCHCNGLCESPEHQQAQKKNPTAHTLTHKHTGARTRRSYTAFRHKAPVKGGGNISSSCLFLSAAADVTDFRARRCMRVLFSLSDVCVCVYVSVCVCVCECVCAVFVSSAVYHWLNKRLLNINSFPLHLPVYDTYIYMVVQGQRYITYIHTHTYICFMFPLPSSHSRYTHADIKQW